MEKIIRNYVVNRFSSVQYSCTISSKREFCFVNHRNSIEIKYDIRQYPLMRRVTELRIYLTIRFGHDCITFSPKRLKPLHTDMDCIVCANRTEFEQAVIQATELLINAAIPLLEPVAQSVISLDDDFYVLLSKDTLHQAARFAACHNRNLQFSPENKAWSEEWLLQLWESTQQGQCGTFRDISGRLIEFAAYIGELLRSKRKDGYWTWFDFPDEAAQKYGVFFPSLENGCDPLSLIIQYWNFSHCIQDINLFPNCF